MIRGQHILALFSGLLLLFGVVIAYIAWVTSQNTTVIVEWSTSSELDTAGFNLYRRQLGSDQETLVNDTLIPASPDPLIGADYEYEDSNVQSGQEYNYYLEEVEFNGTTTRYGPIAVKAQNSGKFAFIFSGIFIILGGFGLWSALFRKTIKDIPDVR